jgi:hypothetical protein
MATLIYSDRCKHCYDVIAFIKTKPELLNVIRYHDIAQGVPQGVTKVPAIITANGQLYSGKQVKAFLYSIAPNKIAGVVLGGKPTLGFSIGKVKSHKPLITPELERKLNRSIDEGLKELQR